MTPDGGLNSRHGNEAMTPVLLCARRLARGLSILSLAAWLPGVAIASSAEMLQPPPSTAPSDALPEVAKDQGWPRQFETSTHVVRIHQPQVEDWSGFDRIRFRAAVVVTPKSGQEAHYGVLIASADTDVSLENRLVLLTNRKVESITFPGVGPAQAERLAASVQSALPAERAQTVSLDRILAQLDPNQVPVRKVEVNLAPPKIYASTKPAVMVIFLGKPRFQPVNGTDLLAATNTNWDVFLDPVSNAYLLRKDQSWYTTPDLLKGPWTPATKLPAGLSKLPADDNWKDVRAALPGTPPSEVTSILVSFEPAELILTRGEPEMEPIPGTRLLMVSNTENELFYKSDEKSFFLLAAGRWFRAPALAGPWSAASASLPADFAAIPDDSDAADVLASVPGTAEANEAAIMASIPQKAVVSKSEVTVNVTYDGNPVFKPIEQTTVQYAYNTPFTVFLVDNRYYCCHNAVWFTSSTPTGAWVVADSVPAAIYTIPPTNPHYNVTYVTIYESTPTTVVTGYTAGYSGAQVAATGAVMFGLGVLIGNALDDDDCCWHYHYSSCFYSYGCGATWHRHSCGFIVGGVRYGPYGGAGGVAWHNPRTGVWGRAGYVYGPHGAAGYRSAYNPATGNSGFAARGVTPYGSWSRGAVSNGDDWVRWGGRTNNVGGSVKGIETSGGAGIAHAEGRYGNGVTIAKDKDGDIYAGRDGNVYKRSDSGWEDARNNTAPERPTTGRREGTHQRELQNAAAQRDRGNRATQRSAAPARRGRGGR